MRTDPDQAREAVRAFSNRTDPAIFDAAWTASLPSCPATPRIEAAGVETNMPFINAAAAEEARITADQGMRWSFCSGVRLAPTLG